MLHSLIDMPRKKSTDKQSREPTDSIRIRKGITAKLRIIAAHEDKSVPDLLADLLTPVVDEAFARVVRELAARGTQTNR